MNVYNLPFDLSTNPEEKSEAIIIRNYAASADTVKNRIVLHKNMINLLICGEKVIQYAEKTTSVTNEQILFIAAGNCLTTERVPSDGRFNSIILYFGSDVLAGFFLKYAGLIEKLSVPRLASEPVLTFSKDTFIHNYISSLTLLLEHSAKMPAEMKLLKFEELMLYLLQKHPELVLSFHQGQNDNEEELTIKKVVEANVTSQVTLEELAFLCNTSLSTFKRRFTKIYGTSPNKWILQRRMEIAAHLLQYHGEKPGEVYYKVGYENFSSFIQSFRQVYGVTPKVYQQQKLNVFE